MGGASVGKFENIPQHYMGGASLRRFENIPHYYLPHVIKHSCTLSVIFTNVEERVI
jgi:hypothetical protein